MSLTCDRVPSAFQPLTVNPKVEQALPHLDAQGQAHIVDVGQKTPSKRLAAATAFVRLLPETFALLQKGQTKKGEALAVARIAGLMAVKRTAELIPLAHPIPVTSARVELDLCEAPCGVQITATVETVSVTGVEMEAMTAVSVAALTLYDMLKAHERGIVIEEIKLLRKEGGKSGAYVRDTDSF